MNEEDFKQAIERKQKRIEQLEEEKTILGKTLLKKEQELVEMKKRIEKLMS